MFLPLGILESCTMGPTGPNCLQREDEASSFSEEQFGHLQWRVYRWPSAGTESRYSWFIFQAQCVHDKWLNLFSWSLLGWSQLHPTPPHEAKVRHCRGHLHGWTMSVQFKRFHLHFAYTCVTACQNYCYYFRMLNNPKIQQSTINYTSGISLAWVTLTVT